MLEHQSAIERRGHWQYPDAFSRSPILTEYENTWNHANLESPHQAIYCFDGLAPHQLKPVIHYVNNRLDQDLGLEELAGIAQLSQYHFSHAFKRSTGMSPHQYVIQQRVERAKLLLKEKKMSICEVAIACGFTHQSHLNRHFKRLTGITPKTFLKS